MIVVYRGEVVQLEPFRSLGKLKQVDTCVYGNCRARNLCKAGHCVGANLRAFNYRIENGALVEETH